MFNFGQESNKHVSIKLVLIMIRWHQFVVGQCSRWWGAFSDIKGQRFVHTFQECNQLPTSLRTRRLQSIGGTLLSFKLIWNSIWEAKSRDKTRELDPFWPWLVPAINRSNWEAAEKASQEVDMAHVCLVRRYCDQNYVTQIKIRVNEQHLLGPLNTGSLTYERNWESF